MFRGFADPTRLSILESLRRGEKIVSEIVRDTKQSQSNVSNHLGCLLGCGLVTNHRDGKNVYYSLRNPKVLEILETSDDILTEIAEDVMRCVRFSE
jgi:DNA-binding transcriptional ArsR family regulator